MSFKEHCQVSEKRLMCFCKCLDYKTDLKINKYKLIKSIIIRENESYYSCVEQNVGSDNFDRKYFLNVNR